MVLVPAILGQVTALGWDIAEGDDTLAFLAVVGLPMLVPSHTDECFLDFFGARKLGDHVY